MSNGSISSVAVMGLGKVGELVAVLLARSGFEVRGYDAYVRAGFTFDAHKLDVTDRQAVEKALADFDAVVGCLPHWLNGGVAEAAAASGTHYFDLTEDVPTTARILELAKKTPGVLFAPQCGLAPGIVGIIGSAIAAEFDELRSIELKVGALPQNPTGLLGYSVNWSADGLINEYLNDAEVIINGRREFVPALSGLERVLINGVEFEAAFTSGGVGTMCSTYEGKVQRLDYKTLRYPGHFKQMGFLFDELGLRNDRELVGQLIVDAKPPVNDDVVHLYVSVEGQKAGQGHRENFVRSYKPIDIDGRVWRAISWTTAASAVAVVELAAQGKLGDQGFVSQEDISFLDLIGTHSGSLYESHGKV